MDIIAAIFKQSFIEGKITLADYEIPTVSTVLSRRDKWEHFKARISSFRNRFMVIPGLYAVGTPDSESEVFISANYQMSFNYLRQALNGTNSLILVLDTKGINVWCAAGKGTFGTAEIIKRIRSHNLPNIVRHRRIIAPQLGAPGISCSEVKNYTGFRIYYGPVRAEDIPKFIAQNLKADDEMRRIKFTFFDRLILTPMEINPALKKYPYLAIIFFILFGLTPEGIIFKKAFYDGLPFYIGGLSAIFTGAFLTPLLLPFIPGRAFAVKGTLVGLAVFIPLTQFPAILQFNGQLEKSAFIIFFTSLSSFLATQFTGSTVYTHLSGVKKELKIALPIYIIGVIISVGLIIFSKFVNL